LQAIKKDYEDISQEKATRIQKKTVPTLGCRSVITAESKRIFSRIIGAADAASGHLHKQMPLAFFECPSKASKRKNHSLRSGFSFCVITHSLIQRTAESENGAIVS